MVGHPVLEFHELALQAKQFAKVQLAVEPLDLGVAYSVIQQIRETLVVNLFLQLFVETVEQIGADALGCSAAARIVGIHGFLSGDFTPAIQRTACDIAMTNRESILIARVCRRSTHARPGTSHRRELVHPRAGSPSCRSSG